MSPPIATAIENCSVAGAPATVHVQNHNGIHQEELSLKLAVKNYSSQPDSNLEVYLSREGKLRQHGTLRSLVGRFQGVPGVVSLAAGFPSPHLFPFSGISLQLSHDDGEGGTPTILELPAECTTAAQQYNSALRGYPPLLEWVIEHVEALHAPPRGVNTLLRDDLGVMITNGSNHALELITSLFLDPGDTLLVEEYTYPVIIESIAVPKGYCPLPVRMDDAGIIPASLRLVLQQSVAAAASGGPPKPKLLYTIPTGQNPTGVTTTAERRREIYQICREYDVWIVEDDPYYYLQYGGTTNNVSTASSSLPGLTGLLSKRVVRKGAHLSSIPTGITTTSYLSMDVDCRVIRVDSFAKFLAPGMRLGWVTARNDVVERLVGALQTHTVGPCSMSQAIVSTCLHAWGDAGLDAHLRRVQLQYSRSCAVLNSAAARELQGLAEWNVPTAGMFIWVRLLGIDDAMEVWEAMEKERVVACPGRAMHAGPAGDGHQTVPSPFLRLAFSSLSHKGIEEGVRRLAKVLREYHQMKE